MTHSNSLERTGLRDERGMALIIAVVLLLLMSALGVAALQQSQDESTGGGRARRKDSTLYAAEAGQALAQSRLFDSWDAMSSTPFPIDEPAMVTDAFGNPIAVRSGAPGPSGLPASPALLDDRASAGGKPKDGFMINLNNANSRSFRAVRTDIVAMDAGNGLVHLQAQYSVMDPVR